MIRNSLKKYYGKEVWVIGYYDGPPIGNKIVHCADINTGIAKNEKCSSLIKMSEIQPQRVRGMLKIDEPSCLKYVRGINGFEDISEDHVNLQFNLEHHGIKKGELIWVHGFVIEYANNNHSIRADSFDKYEEQ